MYKPLCFLGLIVQTLFNKPDRIFLKKFSYFYLFIETIQEHAQIEKIYIETEKEV